MSAAFSRLFAASLLSLATPLISCAQTSAPLASIARALPAPPLFSEAQRAQLVAQWNAPSRYEIGPRPDARTGGAYVVRLTPAASRWFNAYNRALRPNRLTTPKGAIELTEMTRPWETWVAAKIKYDRALAAGQAALANAQLFAESLPAPLAAGVTLGAGTTPIEAPAPHPGPIPLDLLAAIGNAPPFATVATPRRHTIRFESGETIAYTDFISPSNPRNPSFRFAEGVMAVGTALSKIAPEELDKIFAASDLSPVEGRVMRAISLLEGGFDSINTYDTGFLSVGFIQFATLEAGSGSLGDVLNYEKRQNPPEFARDFQDLGVDVTPDGFLVVIDPSSGAELTGNDAVLKIIDDKRLTAVFHLAGQRSTAFRAAQIHVAKTNYYPADSLVSVEIGGQTLTARVGDIIRSEAGLATLFDRKVNTGNIRVLNQVVQNTMIKHGLSKLEQITPFEREIIAAVRWRSDFLKEKSLSQPQ